jgi:ABC-2 type transport system ATP-binding protein
MIEIDQVTKDYGDKRAVDDVSFVVQPGVVTGFLGPNGAGKPTTMRMVVGLDLPTAGSVRVNGRAYGGGCGLVFTSWKPSASVQVRLNA